ncbi:MAG: GGDEF domain-containing protein, partial [Pseudomonadota bacterium]|nr:GGDEF domain-containing protein [Pseudomonadota bacterium]
MSGANHRPTDLPEDSMLLALDTLCPMHCLVDESGNITHCGPTLQKLRPQVTMVGQRFLEVFQTTHPRNISILPDLRN